MGRPLRRLDRVVVGGRQRLGLAPGRAGSAARVLGRGRRLAPARLGGAEPDVGQRALDIAEPGGERLDLAQTPVYLLEALAHELQAVADEGEPLLDPALQRAFE